MAEATHPPRIAFLGAGPEEIQLLLELRDSGAIEIVGVFDANPTTSGIATAELVGVPAGSDATALERLRTAEFIVLPQDRRSAQDAVRWAAGLRAELVPLPEARRRWAALRAVRPERVDSSAAERSLSDAVDASARLQDRADLADWILNVALRTVGANGGSIQILVPETAELYLLAARGLSQRLVRFGRHRVGEGISGTVAATGAPQLVHGTRSGLPPRERGEVQASMSVPLEEGGDLLGVLNVSSTARGKRFGEEHLRALERLTPRMTRLLRDAAELEPGTPRLDVPRLLRRSEAEGVDLPSRLRALCEHARDVLGAESVELYLATEDGNWLRVHGLEPVGAGDLSAARRAELDAAFAERRWVHITEAGSETGDDAVAAAIDRALEPGAAHRSHLACPLEGIEQVGVLVLEFASLDAADRCVRAGTVAVGQLAFGVDALLREHRQNRRLQGFAVLTRSLQRLVDLQGTSPFDPALAEEAAKLTGARMAVVRRVDESARVFSRPVAFGQRPGETEPLRELDARVTERTLLARSAVVTGALADDAQSTALEPLRLSHLSVPFEHEGRIVAVVNVYDKQPRDDLESEAFTTGDRELIETLALVAGRMVARGGASDDVRESSARAVRPEPGERSRGTQHGDAVPAAPGEARKARRVEGPAAAPGIESFEPPPRVELPEWPPRNGQPEALPLEAHPGFLQRGELSEDLPRIEPSEDLPRIELPEDLPREEQPSPLPRTPPPFARPRPASPEPAMQFGSHEPESLAAPPGTPGGTLTQALEVALQDAAAYHRGVGVWVLRFAGLEQLSGAAEARLRLAETVHLGLRADDVVEWTGEEELTLVGVGLPPGSRRLETRLAELVRPQLARLSRTLESGIELRIGSSTFPQDGYEARTLLAAAIERAR